MQSFPVTSPSSALAFARVSAEGQSIPPLSDEQRSVVDGIHRLQAEAAQNPLLNGMDAKRRLREGLS